MMRLGNTSYSLVSMKLIILVVQILKFIKVRHFMKKEAKPNQFQFQLNLAFITGLRVNYNNAKECLNQNRQKTHNQT
jgi:hypothetical protein